MQQTHDADFGAPFDLAGVGAAQVDLRTGRYVRVNRRYCELTGYSRDELLTMSPVDLMHPDERPRDLALLRDVAAGRSRGFSVEKRYVRKDGVVVWAHLVTTLVTDRRDLCLGVVIDVTERKQAEDARRESEERYRALFEACPVGLAITDERGGFLAWNDAVMNPGGYTRDDLAAICDSTSLYATAEERERALAVLARDGHLHRHHVRLRARRGDAYDTLLSIVPIRIGGRPHHLALVEDVTDRLRAEEALRESQRALTTLVAHLPGMAYRCRLDEARTLEFVSAGCLELTGYPPEALLRGERSWTDAVHPDDRESTWATIRAGIGQGRCYEVTYRLLKPSGEERWVCERGEAVFGDDGEPVALEGFLSDVTALKHSERALRELTTTLEQRVAERTAEAERRARQLRAMAKALTQAEHRERRRVAHVLHDHLQQLMTAASLQLATLRPEVSAEGRQRLDQGEALIRECIEVSRSLAVELSPPVLHEGGLSAALEWLAERMRAQYGLEVAVRAPAEAEPASEEVRVLLFQGARELLFNVVKHAGTRQAAVEVTAGEGRVRLQVADEGRGWDAAALGAEGFGLHELRSRLELVGGDLAVDSHPGEGFRVTLRAPAGRRRAPRRPPLRAAPRSDIPPPVRAAGARARVLLVDDHEIVREGVAAILGAQPDLEVVAQAVDGLHAVELARALRPEVVVMDLSMPRMNGIEATRIISAELPEVRVIGLTMHDTRTMVSRMRAAGAVECLTKDGACDHLIRAIRRTLGALEAAGEA